MTTLSLSSLLLLEFPLNQSVFCMDDSFDADDGALVAQVKATSNPDHWERQKVIISQTEPFLEAIQNAEGFLYAGAFKLQNDEFNLNPRVETTVKSVARGFELAGKVELILEGNLTPEEKKVALFNPRPDSGHHSYENLGIKLHHGSFPNTHFKILVSEKYAVVGTTNFDKEFEEGDSVTRDFSLILRDPPLIRELKNVFENDIRSIPSNLKDFEVGKLVWGETRLSWGPNHHRQHFYSLIQQAKTSIEIYQQALQDPPLTNCLSEAITKGIKVSILMSQFPFGSKHGNKSEAEQQKILAVPAVNEEKRAEVRLTGKPITLEGALNGKSLHIHAKVMIIDGNDSQKAFMYLGSANFYTPAIDKDRNVGIITRNSDYIGPVRAQFLQDWEAHKGDRLGDQGMEG